MTSIYGIVLAAGQGKRQRALTDPNVNAFARPKALLPVGNRVAIDFSLEALLRIGAEKIAVSSHLLTNQLEFFLAGQQQYEQVSTYHEPDILDTAGTVMTLLESALQPAGDDIICVLPCDTPHNIGLDRALEAHVASGAVATLVVLPLPWFHPEWRERSFATVSYDGMPKLQDFSTRKAFEQAMLKRCLEREQHSFRITGFHEKEQRAHSPSNLINLGFYIFQAGFLEEIRGLITPRQAKHPFSDFGLHFFPFFCGRHGNFHRLLSKNPPIARKIGAGEYPIFAYVPPADAYWRDLASPLRLLKANMEFLSGRFGPRFALGQDPRWQIASWGWQNINSFVSPAARTSSSRRPDQPDSIVGRFSTVASHARLQHSVVGEYVRLGGEVEHSVIFSGSHHPLDSQERQIRTTDVGAGIHLFNCLVSGGQIEPALLEGTISNAIIYQNLRGELAFGPI